jgi:alpha-2-macroglobulin
MSHPLYLVLALLTVASPAVAGDYAGLKADAERLWVAKSFQQAHDTYLKAKLAELPPDEQRWVRFRLADTEWRSQAAAPTADRSVFEKAQQALSELVRDASRPEDRDRIWVEVQESLGDFWWLRADQRSSSGWSNYQQALDWWAGAANVTLARERYLAIVRRMAQPAWRGADFYDGYFGTVPLPVAENFLEIAKSPDDRILGHYLLAMTLLRSGGDYEQRQRIPAELTAALKGGKANDWYDDALWQYGNFLESQGRLIQTEGEGWRYEPDYPGAVAIYKRILAEFKPGESRFVDEAKRRLEDITRAHVELSVSGIFLPDTFPSLYLSWRNVKAIELVLYRVELGADLQPARKRADDEPDDWPHRIDLSSAKKVKAWTKSTGDQGRHLPGSEQVGWPDKLARGAYVLEVSAAGVKGKKRDLLLVTDAAMTVKSMGGQMIAWFTSALDGAPIPDAKATLWYRNYSEPWRSLTATTDKNGVAPFALKDAQSASEYIVAASWQGRQAFAIGSSGQPPGPSNAWRVYAFTDRPAYRPQEKVEWKFVARAHDGSVYSTPKGEELRWEVTDPRSAKAFEGKARLDAFGTSSGSFQLGASLPLGEYRITFSNQAGTVGSATLFRLEEYKLPEFTVQVKTARENGRPKLYRLGDKVEAEIKVEYYFGGAVANAEVEVLVNQSVHWQPWRPWREYGWYYDDIFPDSGGGYGYGESTIKREVLKTDAGGVARIVFETPRGAGQDFQYRIEARVTDSSRRQVTGSDIVRVSRQRFAVHATPAHWLYRPKDKVTVDFKALDANSLPVSAEGKVRVTRDSWTETWSDGSGKQISGKELAKLKHREGWRLQYRGYHHDEVLARTVKTDAEGKLELSFAAEREGYYRVTWLTEEKGRNPITTETTVWVASDATSDLGYHQDELDIVVDRDTFAVGQEMPVMLVAPVPDRWVLFSVEGEDLYHWQVVHLTGTAKLIHLPVEPRHVPNVFLHALMVSDKQLHQREKQVIVPPKQHFLSVEVTPDRALFQPREEAILSIHAADHAGKPVAAQLAVALVDESVFAIQQEYAGDPRQFFFGSKRGNHVATHSLFGWRNFVTPAEEVASEEATLARDRKARPHAGRAHYNAKESESYADDTMDRAAAPPEMAEAQPAPPAAAATPVMPMVVGERAAAPKKAGMAGGSSGGTGEVQVRSDFRATALFVPSVVTDANGNATVKAKLPDTLTSWRATARAVGRGSQFGVATAQVRTRKPLIVRLQAPRFFVAGDLVTISAVVNNNTSHAFEVAPELTAEGVRVEGALVGGKVKGARQPARSVPPGGDARFDWQVAVATAGPVKLKTVARTGAHADAMELPFVAWPHGVDKTVVRSGKLRGDEARISLPLPERRATRMSVQIAPSQAVTMLDALPYLIDYPYGCTEQTMSRFLPAAIVAKTLRDLGLRPEDAMGRVFGGVDKPGQPSGKPGLEALGQVTDAGLKRLYDFQHSDGGWGWWKPGDSDRFMSAYVLWGLLLTRDAGVAVNESVIHRAAAYLDVNLVNEETQLDRQAWLLHALSLYRARVARGAMTPYQQKAFDNLWKGRERLNAYGRALLALAAVHFQKNEQAKTLAANLENGVVWDKAEDASVLLRNEPSGHALGTAHWGREQGWWHWSEGAVETTAFVLKALVAVDPRHRLVEPAMNWLVKNRRGTEWSNTRDTAITILALSDFLKATGEVATDVEYAVAVNGKEIAAKRIAKAQILSAPSVFEVDAKLLKDGSNDIRITKKKGSALYFSASATFFSLEEPVAPAGNEIFVKRKYFKWAGRPSLLKGYVYERKPLADGEAIVSGERVETVITIEAKNDYEYLVFEDLKPAGFEAVEVKSGQPLAAKELRASAQTRARDDRPLERNQDYTGRAHSVHQELRDRKVALFVDKLEQGVWEIRYDLRAEAPGRFHALPALGQAMYVPEIRCNGDEVRVTVLDR